MKAGYCAVLPVFAVLVLFSVAPAEEDLPRRFTNEDLKQYNKPNDFTAPLKKDRGPAERAEGLKKKEEAREKEYWCKRGSLYKRKMERIRDKLGDLNKKLSESEAEGRKKKDLKTRMEIEKMETLLKDTEQESEDLAAEAHRKGVPPGWLECRFEW